MDIIECFAHNRNIEQVYQYYLDGLSAKWEVCQQNILAGKVQYIQHDSIIAINRRFKLRVEIASSEMVSDKVSELKKTIRDTRISSIPLNIEDELNKIIPLERDDNTYDLMWNMTAIAKIQSESLQDVYIPYVQKKMAKIEKIWQTTKRIAVDTVIKLLVMMAYLGCGSVKPLYFVKRWGLNYGSINLASSVWKCIYPVFERPDEVTMFDGLINNILLIHIPIEGCSSDHIQNELSRLTRMKEVLYNLNYITRLRDELIDYDFDKEDMILPKSRVRRELLELREQHGYDLLLNIVIMGMWLLFHDCYHLPYRYNHVDLDFQNVIKFYHDTEVDWSPFMGEIYHIIMVYFNTKNSDGLQHNGSDFKNAFGIGYGEVLEDLEMVTSQHLSINKLVVWYTLHTLYRLKSII